MNRLLAVALLALMPLAAHAEDEVPASGYTPLAGESFFVLT